MPMMLITRNDDAGSCDDADNDTDGGDHVVMLDDTHWKTLTSPLSLMAQTTRVCKKVSDW